jgi:hypothetical protein
MDLMQHVLNVTGFGVKVDAKAFDVVARPGAEITYIRWDGCMATERTVVKVGTLVRPEMDHGYPGWIVQYADHRQWEPLDYMRVADGKVEVWH